MYSIPYRHNILLPVAQTVRKQVSKTPSRPRPATEEYSHYFRKSELPTGIRTLLPYRTSTSTGVEKEGTLGKPDSRH
jgi:hypothetical protein